MNYIYYQTKTKFINTGDALINNALISVLRKYGKLSCNCSKEIPDFFIEELGIDNEEKITSQNEIGFVLKIIKKKMQNKKNEVYIVSGLGHHFGKSIKKTIKNCVAGLIVFPIYKLFGIKIIRIGFSIGPFSYPLGLSEKIRSICLDGYYVRDNNSLKLAQKYGIKKAKFCPDMSWLYLLDKERKINECNIITICLRKSIFDLPDDEYEKKLINSLTECIKTISSKYKNIQYNFIYQVEEDKDFSQKLYKMFSKEYKCKFINEQINLVSASKYYKESFINISNRMHSVLLSYKYGSLPIALTDLKRHKKISQTLCDCGFEEVGLDINGENKILNIIDNRSEIMNKIFRIEKDKQKEIISVLDNIFGREISYETGKKK